MCVDVPLQLVEMDVALGLPVNAPLLCLCGTLCVAVVLDAGSLQVGDVCALCVHLCGQRVTLGDNPAQAVAAPKGDHGQ
ncbi:hypothetical protein [Stenotrophomonas maltophilia]|uniref:hypothetical protein n=1 Tax=Stenotrophomonas maltophilia TaxID=40324 RepID=UPI002B1CE29D|nr:hypothetical protein [Stenotrophomonas maltophilia]